MQPSDAVKKTGQIDVIVDPPGSGSVESSITFDDEGVPVGSYTAQPASGYVFDGWQGLSSPRCGRESRVRSDSRRRRHCPLRSR